MYFAAEEAAFVDKDDDVAGTRTDGAVYDEEAAGGYALALHVG
jgi:hypothetical protein